MAKCENLRMILGKLGRILEAKGIHSSYWISQLEQRLQEEEAARIASLMQKEIEYIESACFTPDEVKRWVTEEIIGYEEVDVSEWGGAPWAVSEPYAKFPIYQDVEHVEVVRRGSYVPLLLQVKV